MKIIKVTLLVSMFALLGGCMMVPVAPGIYAPAYVGPSIGIGVYGGGHGGHGGGYDRGWGHR